MKKEKSFKKFLAFVLAFVMCFSFSTLTMAKETGSADNAPGNRMWASGTYSVPAGSTVTTGTFYVPDQRFAVEMSATGSSSGTFTVKLKKSPGGTKVTGNFYLNSGNHKIDNISVTPGNFYFEITNNTSSSISVSLTYYSW